MEQKHTETSLGTAMTPASANIHFYLRNLFLCSLLKKHPAKTPIPKFLLLLPPDCARCLEEAGRGNPSCLHAFS